MALFVPVTLVDFWGRKHERSSVDLDFLFRLRGGPGYLLCLFSLAGCGVKSFVLYDPQRMLRTRLAVLFPSPAAAVANPMAQSLGAWVLLALWW